MKKSLEKAIQDAIKMSKEHPGITYHVMDKKGKKAGCYVVDWCVKELVLDGYHTDSRYRDGKKI